MGRIPDDELERVKKSTDLVALVHGAGVELVRHGGKDLVGRCPFHEDSEPSLVVSPEKRLFHCLGCGAAGSVVDWVMRSRGVAFREAVGILQAGLPAPAVEREPECPVDPAASGAELLGQVVAFYHATLADDPAGLAYLERRGLADPLAVERFELGLSNRSLGLRLPSKARRAGAQLRARLQALGVLRPTGHEHLTGCLTIPVRDEAGRVAEVYGRRLCDHDDRPVHLYLPGPHGGVFNLDALRESKEVILCEALLDALTFWVAGFHNVTSSFGVNGFTDDILQAMRSCGTTRVLVAYDRDQAGDRAAAKLGELLAGEGVTTFRVLFPRDMDANEYALATPPATASLAMLLRAAEYLAGPLPRQPVAKARATTSATAGAEAAPPLAAPVPPSAGDPPPASPVPPAPVEVEAEVKEKETVMVLGDRRWRVRGLERSTSYEQLRVNVLVSRQGTQAYHVDTFDLYSARQRALFVKEAAAELAMKREDVKQDLGRVLLKLEQLQDDQIQAALRPKQEAVTLSPEERAEALELLEDPKLLERVVADLGRCGVVGEETNKLVGYLAVVSRKLTEPLAVLVQSSSAAGKSALMNAVLSLTPPEERVQYSAMTGQSLFYMGEADLKHKVLAVAEEEGAERAAYALKLLQSEGELTIASTGKDPATGRLVTHSYRVEGPVAIFLTTTAVDVDEELLNRCLVLSVDEDREQTRAIHRVQRERRTLAGLKASHERGRLERVHSNAQRLLAPLPVVNPYAPRLTFLDTRTRTRRDHQKYLTLVEAVTLLHQHQRPRRSLEDGGRVVEYVEATVDDVAVANRLAAEVLGRTLDELPPQTRRFLELLSGLVDRLVGAKGLERGRVRFSRREVLDHTGWSYPQVRRHLEHLVELEYVLVHRGHRGQSFVYELLWQGEGRDGGAFLIGLVDVDELRRTNGSTRPLTPSIAALTPEKPGFDPPMTPGRPPGDPRLTPDGLAAKESSSGTSDPDSGNSADNAHLGPRHTRQVHTTETRAATAARR